MHKRVLDRIEAGYALLIDRASYGDFLFVGSEKKGGESRVIRLDTSEVSLATDQVGGMMHIVSIPRTGGVESGGYLAAMGMYAPFIGRDAGVYRLKPGAAWGDPWTVKKLFDAPFVHRLGFVETGGRVQLLVAVVSTDKKNPDDWEQPGRLFAADLGDGLARGEWVLQPVGDGLFRHHGMWTGKLDGRMDVFISAADGLFAVRDTSSRADDVGGASPAGQGLGLECIIAEEISEMVVSDLDGDGVDEIVTIEPFHGNRLRVYKRGAMGDGAGGDHDWKALWQCEDLSFAHGLNVVPVGGRNLIVVGNRRAGCELLAFDFQRSTGEFRRIVIDEGVGPTQIEPWFGTAAGRDGAGPVAIISCNQAAGEVAMYDLTNL